MYEIALRRGVTAAELAEELDLDRGYLSRILKRFTIDKLLSQRVATKDARRRHLQLTSAGRKRFAKLNQKAQLQVTEMLSTLDEAGLQSVINGMQAIDSAFSHQFNSAEIILRSHRPGDGQRLGSVFLVAKDNVTAKLRLLLVDPAARGCGLDRRLVDECVKFARHAGYRKVVLWTQKSLSAARHIYSQVGFQKIAEESHNNFGPNLIDETWSLDLDPNGS
jgi:DNA-binding MarR family transcriptional regulator